MKNTAQISTSRQNKARRFLFLDGLRGYAILAVVLMHLAEPLGKIHPAVGLLVDSGKHAVIVFFFLSGYGICIKLSHIKQFSYARFILGRFVKLAPLYYAILLGTLALYATFRILPPDYSWKDIVYHLTFTNFDFISTVAPWSILGLEWTMPIIFSYYLILPFFYFLGKREKIYLYLFLLASVIVVLHPAIFSPYTLNLPWGARLSIQHYIYTYVLSVITFWIFASHEEKPNRSVLHTYIYVAILSFTSLMAVRQSHFITQMLFFCLNVFSAFLLLIYPQIPKTRMKLRIYFQFSWEVLFLCIFLYWGTYASRFFSLTETTIFLSLLTSIFIIYNHKIHSSLFHILLTNGLIVWLAKISYPLFLVHLVIYKLVGIHGLTYGWIFPRAVSTFILSLGVSSALTNLFNKKFPYQTLLDSIKSRVK